MGMTNPSLVRNVILPAADLAILRYRAEHYRENANHPHRSPAAHCPDREASGRGERAQPGTFTFLPDEAVIEVSCDVSSSGAAPRPVGLVAPSMAGLIAHVSAYEELAIDAALRGGRERVYQTLLAHPLIGQHDRATQLTDALIAGNRQYLAWAR